MNYPFGCVVALSRQIGHYHKARFEAAYRVVPGLHVLLVANEVEFKELAAVDGFSFPASSLFDSLSAYRSAITRGGVSTALGRALCDLKPDVLVISGWGSPESFAGLAWAKRNGVPVVVMAESQAHDAPRNWLTELIKSRFVRLCDAALVGGPTHTDYMVQLGMSVEQVFLGYDAIDNDHFERRAAAARSNASARRVAIGLPERYLLATGRFMAKKNFPRLIRCYAAAVASANGDTPDLVILGDGSDRPIIEAAAEATGLGERIHLPGFQGYNVLPDYYGLSECFVHISLVEQWGLVINEAMAAGVPVVASSMAGATAALMEDGVTGYIVAPDDDRAIEIALGKIISAEAAQRTAMGKAAAAAVATWGPERFATGFGNAIACATLRPLQRGLSLLDQALFQMLARTEIKGVK